MNKRKLMSEQTTNTQSNDKYKVEYSIEAGTILRRLAMYGGLAALWGGKQAYKSSRVIMNDPEKRRLAVKGGKLALDFMLFKGKIRRMLFHYLIGERIHSTLRRFIFKPDFRKKVYNKAKEIATP